MDTDSQGGLADSPPQSGGTLAHMVECLTFEHTLTQDGTYVPTADIVNQEDHTPPQNVPENE